MTTVGIEEMRDRLGEYVRRAQQGEVILVTEHGEVMARLTPPSAEGSCDDDVVDRLEADGLISSRGAGNCPELYEGLTPALPKGAAQVLLEAVRGDR